MNVVAGNKSRSASNPYYFLDRALEPIRDFLDDPLVVEISVNKPGHVYVERLGADHMEFHQIPALSAEEIQNIGERVAGVTSQFISRSKPILSAALPTGERIQIVLPPAAPEGGSISIRKQVVNNFTLEEYRDNGSLDKVSVAVGGLSDIDRELIALLRANRIYDFIHTAITKRVSILISGGTSSGKTTFLNACLKSVDPHERIVTLEDTRELFPPQSNKVHLIASKGDQGTADVTIQNLLEASLRMRPDRLFVGEIRGAEAFSFLRAINTGHPGSMSTVHADTPMGAYEQLAMMMQQAGMSAGFWKQDLMSYIQMVIPIVIQLRRDGGKRGVSEILFARDES
ncbi:MAG: P-type DNA transfer ATPase VirB11 [Mesorhizobium sp.]|uniref:P-type DNA transfer ATPase VirB11 n=1 Tax=unclassified Mesorhizobium TaxID=325217 RepID=UPI000FCB4449|nr:MULTISPECIES: P-type DNA transfer ATPase VirB11 [unclassified Mesorhizobium]MCT2581277.1 P-type DNA transfer ATPase VirB11 [Mesorhizobium sp. P13.3]MDF3170328.1 P-type DNA transfer ATPase VirB11 [Mesorhizobium sp. P16.1]MDF3181243.1 P-type DNA transfer ATPase VirB11 [Mesorhizobium sp. P17.1]MDF3187190.1 P-type DNA transfer ATPase VirB11 [Mesorhizobium sp. ICCV3110.1]RUV58006.1 P-type DNA transfer ATPase VirB11 [Mesorhizobium sp. M1A.F.Ca.IN.022.02.1.1]